jgi:proline iminopeptidase
VSSRAARTGVALSLGLASVAAILCGCAEAERREPRPPMATELATIGERTIEYAVRGSGPVAMVVPNSWGLSLEGLVGLFGGLEERLTLVYFNPRGLGRSSPVAEDSDRGPEAVREDFLALARHLGHERVDAIGWSNGATNLLLLAAEHPEALGRAVLVQGVASFDSNDLAPLAGRPEYEPIFRAFGEFRGEMLQVANATAEEQNRRFKRFDVEVWFPLVTADPDLSRERLRQAFGDATFSWRHMQYTNRLWSAIDIRESLPAVTTPLLLVSGAHDVVPPAKAEEIAGGVGGEARVEIFESSGHFPPLEEPERFTRLVWDFLGAS